LRTDQVKIYKFAADGSGEVIAEFIHQQNLPYLVRLHFPGNDVPLSAKEMFLLTRQRSIVSAKNGKSLLTENIHYLQLHPYHIQYLKAMGVKYFLVVPIHRI
jgi:light-regulated signal transduction histidine kinase (bacteriophytochrome)